MTIYSRDIKRIDEITNAIAEATRFIAAAKDAREALASKKEYFHHSKSFAAAKRSSMDLTRALAKMRGRAS